MAGGTGLPPVRLDHEGTIFGALAVPAFAVMGAMPVALLIPHRRLRRAMLIGLAVVAVPLTLLSGSRSAWLAAAVAGLVLVAPAAMRRLRPSWLALVARSRRLTPRDVGLAVAGLAVLALAVAFIAPRLTDVRSLVYRGYLWRDTLAAWSEDPVFGIGPGSMPLARQAAAPPLSFPVRQPHSHDIPLGILGDAGLVGLAAALALFVTFVVVAGPWRLAVARRPRGFRRADGLRRRDAVRGPDLPACLQPLVIVLVAMALLDAGVVRWQPIARAARLPAAVIAGVADGSPGGGHGGGRRERHRLSQRDRCRERRPLARGLQPRSATPPPSTRGTRPARRRWPSPPTGWASPTRRALPPRRRCASAPAMARRGSTWRCSAASRATVQCARHAADRAVDAATPQGRELVNAAIVYEWLGDTAAADRAYRLSMLATYLTGLTQAVATPDHDRRRPGRASWPRTSRSGTCWSRGA